MRRRVVTCEGCPYWEQDPVPYNGIFFGKCTRDGKIKYEFHECEYQEERIASSHSEKISKEI
ncbi:MAG: hypothetical protein DRN21_01940 [Thermoplasmata archaeon]|nr:MAG: hypothetical protein DRN21_01940 [Thermoplasmata archaeon]